MSLRVCMPVSFEWFRSTPVFRAGELVGERPPHETERRTICVTKEHAGKAVEHITARAQEICSPFSANFSEKGNWKHCVGFQLDVEKAKYTSVKQGD